MVNKVAYYCYDEHKQDEILGVIFFDKEPKRGMYYENENWLGLSMMAVEPDSREKKIASRLRMHALAKIAHLAHIYNEGKEPQDHIHGVYTVLKYVGVEERGASLLRLGFTLMSRENDIQHQYRITLERLNALLKEESSRALLANTN